MTNAPSQISTIDDLYAERRRLLEQIRLQKSIIQNDVAELKAEVKTVILPVTETARLVKKFTTPETRYNSLLQIGTATLLDVLIRRLFARSPLLIQLIVPTLMKNFSTRMLFTLMNQLEQQRKNNRTDKDLHLIH